jgi:hypothetical protein
MIFGLRVPALGRKASPCFGGFALAAYSLLGCRADVAGTSPDGSAPTDGNAGGTSEESNADGAPPSLPPFGLDAGGLAPLPTIEVDAGCTLSASSPEGACSSDQDCLGTGGTLPCVNGMCPPFCTDVPHLGDVQPTPDGSVLCAQLSGPVSADAAVVGPTRWCVPGQTCTPYAGVWGCCTVMGNNSFCVMGISDDGGS